MPPITTLTAYRDDAGNEIVYTGPPVSQGVNITFRGANNTMRVAPNVKIGRLSVTFDCDNGTFQIGGHGAVPAFRANKGGVFINIAFGIVQQRTLGDLHDHS